MRLIETQIGQREMANFKAQWALTTTPVQRVILGGRVLSLFGDALEDQQDLGWPCPMLRAIACMVSAA